MDLERLGMRVHQLEKWQEKRNEDLGLLFRALEKAAPGIISQTQREMIDEWNREHGFNPDEATS